MKENESTDRSQKAGSSPWRSCRWHAVLIAVLVIECLAGWMVHRSDADLRQILASEDGIAQVEALFVLTNRDTPLEMTPEKMDDLWEKGNPLLREWMLTTNFARFDGSLLVKDRIKGLADPAAVFRCRLFFEHQIGMRRSLLTLSKIDRYFKSLE